jgi:2-polyprenyl-3-methyl-5-hydroxy-6-metoxy-1,4-benzoquinol methylase
MSILSADYARTVNAHYGGASLGRIVDVGGGQGTLLASLLHANLQSSGILLERADVIEQARALMEDNGLSTRCQCIAGDFMQSVPEGADTCILSSILHNWDDEKSITILRNCRNAINATGRILILDYVLEPDSKPHANLLDLHMLVMHGGQERTCEEFNSLISAAGLRLERITPMSNSCIIECRCK